MKQITPLGLLVFSSFFVPSVMAECTVTSSAQPVALLELYTSEGCSSCPPADRWLSKLQAPSSRVIPLALHVDYWDYIGWKDKFAQLRFSERQREQARLAWSNTVYTPQVMLNGKDFRAWGNPSRFNDVVESINQGVAQANIKLNMKRLEPNVLEVTALAQTVKPGNAAIYIALYENGLSSDVKAGENSGEKLNHDYVVREWLGPFSLDQAQAQRIILKPEWKLANMGAVAFVQNRSNSEVLQAVASKLCG